MIQARILVLLGAAAVLLGLAAAGGGAVGAWKAQAECAASTEALRVRVETLAAEKHALELAIAEQNKAVAVAEARTQAARAAQAAAEQNAARQAQLSDARLAKLEETFGRATSCDEVLQSYWEMRK